MVRDMKESNFYICIRPILTFLFKIIYKPTFINKENIIKEEGIILAGNHTNNFDCLSLIASTKRPIHFFTKIELFQGPFGFIFKSLGLIPVDRKRKNKDALDQGYKYLNENMVVGIFPEGTYHKKEKTLLPFKIGAVKMAYETKKKIVPFAIIGKYRRGKIKIIYGKAYSIISNDLEKENEKLKKKIIKLIKDNEV